MNLNYRSFRLLLVSLSYFYLLELALTDNFYPGLAQGIEYLTWLGVVFFIFFLVWLITDTRQVELSAGLWLIMLFASLWLDLHRQQLVGLGIKNLLFILTPSLIFLVSFLLWLWLIFLDRLQHSRQEMLYSALLIFPLGILVFRQNLIYSLFNFNSVIGTIIFSSLVLGLCLFLGGLLFLLKPLHIFHLSRVWLVLVLPTAIFALFGPIQAEIQKKQSIFPSLKNLPDLILITVDTLRQDHLGVYSQTKFSTPNFDRLAQDSIIFDNAISPSNWTLPAIASWLTGLYPHQHQAGKLIWYKNTNELSFSSIVPEATTLAQELKKKGYYTSAFLDNAWLREFGFPKGFDYYFLFYPPELGKNLIGLKLVKAFYYLFNGRYQDFGGAWLTDRVITWLKKNSDKKPLFLWVHYFDPHLPYRAHPEYPINIKVNPGIGRALNRSSPEFIRAGYHNLSQQDKEFIHQRYIGEVIYTDRQFGKLLKVLQEQNRYQDSVIIFCSDHGEEFWDHGGFDHGHTFFQELIKVPLFLKLPQNQKAGQRIFQPVSTAQIYNTFLKFAGYPNENGSGQSPWENLPDLMQVSEDPSQAPKLFLSEFSFYFDLIGAVIDQNLTKIILAPNNEKLAFDLNLDPQEKNPLPLEQIPPELLTVEIPATELGARKESLSPETRQELKALGYLK